MSGNAVWALLRAALVIGLAGFSFAAGCSGGTQEHHAVALVRCSPGVQTPGCAKLAGAARLARSR